MKNEYKVVSFVMGRHMTIWMLRFSFLPLQGMTMVAHPSSATTPFLELSPLAPTGSEVLSCLSQATIGRNDIRHTKHH